MIAGGGLGWIVLRTLVDSDQKLRRQRAACGAASNSWDLKVELPKKK
jgi:hypothetical protein